ncbi:MAG TPA: aldolase/citrate lyase family protein, partial [Pirellula sp.]|nr:aldolase/citrate lyase family protein [Pirellula sp.]
MNTDAIKKFRSRLSAGQPVYGLWVTLESASITEMAVALGMDWIVVDAEHGHLDWSRILEHIRAAVRSETVVLVRIAERDTALTKRALDIGADGIVVPMIETVEQLQEALRDCWYPPEGRRGIGGERATAWGQCLMEHASEANEQVLVVPIIETARTLPAVMAMSEVSGTSVFFFGPADLSATSGYRGHWEGPGVADQIIAAKDILHSAGKYCGVLARNPEDLTLRLSQRFQMIGLGTDAGMLLRSTRHMLQVAGRDRNPSTSLDPRDGSRLRETLQAPPERMQSDRGDVVTCCSGSEVDLQRDVVSSPQNAFRIALTADFYYENGQPRYKDFGLSVFKGHKHIEVTNFARHDLVIQPEQLAGAHGVIVLTPRVTRESLANSYELLAIGRFGVGYDSVDVSACSEANVLAMIASGAVNHSMAEATVAWMLALTHHVSVKDRLTRTGRWHDRSGFMGCE